MFCSLSDCRRSCSTWYFALQFIIALQNDTDLLTFSLLSRTVRMKNKPFELHDVQSTVVLRIIFLVPDPLPSPEILRFRCISWFCPVIYWSLTCSVSWPLPLLDIAAKMTFNVDGLEEVEGPWTVRGNRPYCRKKSCADLAAPMIQICSITLASQPILLCVLYNVPSWSMGSILLTVNLKCGIRCTRCYTSSRCNLYI